MKTYGFLLLLSLPQSAVGFGSSFASRPSSSRLELKASVEKDNKSPLHHVSTVAASFILASSLAFTNPQIVFAEPATRTTTQSTSSQSSSVSSSPSSVASDPFATLKSDVATAQAKLTASLDARSAAKLRLSEAKAVETNAIDNLAQSEKSYIAAKQTLIQVNDLLAKAKVKEANGDASAAKLVQSLTSRVEEAKETVKTAASKFELAKELKKAATGPVTQATIAEAKAMRVEEFAKNNLQLTTDKLKNTQIAVQEETRRLEDKRIRDAKEAAERKAKEEARIKEEAHQAELRKLDQEEKRIRDGKLAVEKAKREAKEAEEKATKEAKEAADSAKKALEKKRREEKQVILLKAEKIERENRMIYETERLRKVEATKLEAKVSEMEKQKKELVKAQKELNAKVSQMESDITKQLKEIKELRKSLPIKK